MDPAEVVQLGDGSGWVNFFFLLDDGVWPCFLGWRFFLKGVVTLSVCSAACLALCKFCKRFRHSRRQPVARASPLKPIFVENGKGKGGNLKMVIVPSPIRKSPPPAFVSEVTNPKEDSLDTNVATMKFAADSSDSEDESTEAEPQVHPQQHDADLLDSAADEIAEHEVSPNKTALFESSAELPPATSSIENDQRLDRSPSLPESIDDEEGETNEFSLNFESDVECSDAESEMELFYYNSEGSVEGRKIVVDLKEDPSFLEARNYASIETKVEPNLEGHDGTVVTKAVITIG